jgi:hypothetical protein
MLNDDNDDHKHTKVRVQILLFFKRLRRSLQIWVSEAGISQVEICTEIMQKESLAIVRNDLVPLLT